MTCRPIFSLQTPTCSDTSSWQRWRWARVDNGNETAARRPRANLRPFPPPEPSDLSSYKLYLPLPTFSSSPVDSSWWQPCQKRRNHLPVTDKHISSAVCDPPSSFFLSLFFSLFLPQVLWFLSLDAVSKETLKKKEIWKYMEEAVIYTHTNPSLWWSQNEASAHTHDRQTSAWFSRCLKNMESILFLLSRALFFSPFYSELSRRIWGVSGSSTTPGGGQGCVWKCVKQVWRIKMGAVRRCICVWDTCQDHIPIWLYILTHQVSLRPLTQTLRWTNITSRKKKPASVLNLSLFCLDFSFLDPFYLSFLTVFWI